MTALIREGRRSPHPFRRSRGVLSASSAVHSARSEARKEVGELLRDVRTVTTAAEHAYIWLRGRLRVQAPGARLWRRSLPAAEIRADAARSPDGAAAAAAPAIARIVRFLGHRFRTRRARPSAAQLEKHLAEQFASGASFRPRIADFSVRSSGSPLPHRGERSGVAFLQSRRRWRPTSGCYAPPICFLRLDVRSGPLQFFAAAWQRRFTHPRGAKRLREPSSRRVAKGVCAGQGRRLGPRSALDA